MVCTLWIKFTDYVNGKPGRPEYTDAVTRTTSFLSNNPEKTYYVKDNFTNNEIIIGEFLGVENISGFFYDEDFVFKNSNGYSTKIGIRDLKGMYFKDSKTEKNLLVEVLGYEYSQSILKMNYL